MATGGHVTILGSDTCDQIGRDGLDRGRVSLTIILSIRAKICPNKKYCRYFSTLNNLYKVEAKTQKSQDPI